MSPADETTVPRWSSLPAEDRRRAALILGPGIQRALARIADRREAAPVAHARAA